MALDLSSLPAMSKNSVEREGKREGLGGGEFRNKGTRDNRNNLMVTGNGEMSKATHLDIAKCYFRPILTPVLPANPFHFRIIVPCIQSVVAVTISGWCRFNPVVDSFPLESITWIWSEEGILKSSRSVCNVLLPPVIKFVLNFTMKTNDHCFTELIWISNRFLPSWGFQSVCSAIPEQIQSWSFSAVSQQSIKLKRNWSLNAINWLAINENKFIAWRMPWNQEIEIAAAT